MVSKIEIINRAATRLKISGLTVLLTAEDIRDWISYLDDFMSLVANNNYPDIGYIQPDNYGGSDVNDDSGLERWMVKPVSILLADDIAGSYGKTGVITPREITGAEDDLASGLVSVGGARFPITMPIGQANEYPYRFSNFYQGNNPKQPIVRPTINISFGEINDYRADMRNYLNDGETIASYDITTTAGLSVLSSSESDGVIIYRLQCGDFVAEKQTVSIYTKTSTGRERYYIINATAQNNFNNENNI